MIIKKLDIEYRPKIWGQEIVFVNDSTITKDDSPILIKILQAKDNLSYQIHPTQEYCDNNNLKGSKDEVWYVINTSSPSQIALGVKPNTTDYLREHFLNGELQNIINYQTIQNGDYIYIESGTVHMLGANNEVLEIEQNNETTYRLYDYKRDRELNLNEGIANLKINNHSFIQHKENFKHISPHFKVRKYNIKNHIYIDNSTADYCYIIPIDNDAILVNGEEKITLQKKYCYLIKNEKVLEILGNLNLIITNL